ncbi:dihydroorotate dehydrogenase-like protein [Opitutales bacterium ASA1]|jgi:dihydroorotate dehydrogenase (fumarate)|uniref:dihydroorotate dehydrogenase-like protein n=1 Tax=Congregicoccus parvus TaxID=3081749 RepID=UPI002B285A98|nr:dihydroorotate dehydrogenase-like protein [Opitutales bacterium ASA1]
MNLETKYLGLTLKNPLMPGASPLVDNLDTARNLEDAGAGAIVMHSLFEEQAIQDQWSSFQLSEGTSDSFAEATSFFPKQEDYHLGPEQYLEQIRKLKEALGIPVIASLNGTRIGGWIDYAKNIQQAGADAIELNVYYLATDPSESADDVESRTLDILRAVRSAVSIPIAVKLSPFYSSLAHFAAQIDALGTNGIVLFNRFYQPDIDPDALETVPKLELSSSAELRLRLRWLGVLFGTVRCSLACSGGVHRAVDAIKAIMAGADAVQCVSSLLHFGPKHLSMMLDSMRYWMEEREYASLDQMRGSMSLRHCPDPAAYERANYLKVLQIWKV